MRSATNAQARTGRGRNLMRLICISFLLGGTGTGTLGRLYQSEKRVKATRASLAGVWRAQRWGRLSPLRGETVVGSGDPGYRSVGHGHLLVIRCTPRSS